MLAGIGLMMWSVIELWRIGHNSYLGIHSGAFKATLIALGFSCFCIFGSAGSILRTNWGRIIILSVATMTLLYAVAYLLLGGFEDAGPIYAAGVFGLLLVSIVTFAVLVRRKNTKKEQLNN